MSFSATVAAIVKAPVLPPSATEPLNARTLTSASDFALISKSPKLLICELEIPAIILLVISLRDTLTPMVPEAPPFESPIANPPPSAIISDVSLAVIVRDPAVSMSLS